MEPLKKKRRVQWTRKIWIPPIQWLYDILPFLEFFDICSLQYVNHMFAMLITNNLHLLPRRKFRSIEIQSFFRRIPPVTRPLDITSRWLDYPVLVLKIVY